MKSNELILSKIYKEEKESLLFNQLTKFYATHFKQALSTLGHGVIINGEGGNLSPNIMKHTATSNNITVSFEEGSFIDKEGRLIVVSHALSQSFNIDEFSQKRLFFYITPIEVIGQKIEHAGGFVIQDTIISAKIVLSIENKSNIGNHIELCRIFIDKDKVFHPSNPFSPKESELDIRFVPRILSNNALNRETLYIIAGFFYDYACFFTKLIPQLNSFTTSLVASDAYASANKIKLDNFSTFEIYILLSQLVKITILFYDEVKDKIENIENSDFKRSLTRLESIFFLNESTNEGVVKFYDFSLNEQNDKKSFWENIFAHIRDISDSKDEWKLIVKKEEVVPREKKYLLLGRLGGEKLDIAIDYEYISGNHLKITKNDINPQLLDIEDLGSTNGTYFQGIRYEQYKKVTISKNGKIELYDYEFDIYSNPVIQKFLENLI